MGEMRYLTDILVQMNIWCSVFDNKHAFLYVQLILINFWFSSLQDEQIKREKSTFSIRGGCAVIVAIFAMGKLFVANAGDCR